MEQETREDGLIRRALSSLFDPKAVLALPQIIAMQQVL
jgi:hypothetical protein